MAGLELAGTATGMSESELEQTPGAAGWGDEALGESEGEFQAGVCNQLSRRRKRNEGFREGRRFAKAQYFCPYMIVIVDGWTQEVGVLIHGAFSDAPRRGHRQ